MKRTADSMSVSDDGSTAGSVESFSKDSVFESDSKVIIYIL